MDFTRVPDIQVTGLLWRISGGLNPDLSVYSRVGQRLLGSLNTVLGLRKTQRGKSLRSQLKQSKI